MTKAWEIVREMETKAESQVRELNDAKATMIVNFGPNGRTIKGIVEYTDTITEMIRKLYNRLSLFEPVDVLPAIPIQKTVTLDEKVKSTYDGSFPGLKEAWRLLCDARERIGWKDFYFMILKIQKETAGETGYMLKKSH